MDISALTVGIGAPFNYLSVVAARCVEQHLGIPVTILREESLGAFGIKHPAALRLRMFDFCKTDFVLYFDADWLCLRPYDLLPLIQSNSFLATRDFVRKSEWPEQKYDFDSTDFLGPTIDASMTILTAELRNDYISDVRAYAKNIGPVNKWINSGLLIASRSAHEVVFRHAERLYFSDIGHHPRYYEQPSIQQALHECSADVRYLSRRFNVLCTKPTRWPSSVIGLHIKAKNHVDFIESICSRPGAEPQAITKWFTQGRTH